MSDQVFEATRPKTPLIGGEVINWMVVDVKVAQLREWLEANPDATTLRIEGTERRGEQAVELRDPEDGFYELSDSDCDCRCHCCD